MERKETFRFPAAIGVLIFLAVFFLLQSVHGNPDALDLCGAWKMKGSDTSGSYEGTLSISKGSEGKLALSANLTYSGGRTRCWTAVGRYARGRIQYSYAYNSVGISGRLTGQKGSGTEVKGSYMPSADGTRMDGRYAGANFSGTEVLTRPGDQGDHRDRRDRQNRTGALSGKDLAAKLGKVADDLIFDGLATEATDATLTSVHIPGSNLSTSTRAGVLEALAKIGVRVTDPDAEIPVCMPAASYDPEYGPDRGFFRELYGDQAKIKELEALMTTQLKDLKVVVIGPDDGSYDAVHPLYIIGTARDGSVVGLKSYVVWT
jgi:hypothetical protein